MVQANPNEISKNGVNERNSTRHVSFIEVVGVMLVFFHWILWLVSEREFSGFFMADSLTTGWFERCGFRCSRIDLSCDIYAIAVVLFIFLIQFDFFLFGLNDCACVLAVAVPVKESLEAIL